MSKSLRVRRLTNFWEKTRGLIGRNDLKAVYFETRWGIHTFFLKRPIMVLVLDKNHTVQSIKVVLPNRIHLWNPLYYRVIEVSIAKNTLKFRRKEKLKITFV